MNEDVKMYVLLEKVNFQPAMLATTKIHPMVGLPPPFLWPRFLATDFQVGLELVTVLSRSFPAFLRIHNGVDY